MGFAATAVSIIGRPCQHRSQSARGTEAVRNFCGACGGLVFGGIMGVDTSHTIYAGSLDDPSLFRPSIGIFARDRPDWVDVPAGITLHATMPD